MEFLPEEISAYAEKHTESESPILSELARETQLKVLMPRMLSGHLQGRFLSLISKLLAPEQILEIGTYTGYSALCMAEGLKPNGKLITIDINEELLPMVKRYITRAGMDDKIIPRTGNALDIIPTLQGPFDLVFIDADKINYSNYFDLVIDKVRPGGLIIADNVLWSGKVTGGEKDKDTTALRAYNEKVLNDNRVVPLLLPLRDGLLIARKS